MVRAFLIIFSSIFLGFSTKGFSSLQSDINKAASILQDQNIPQFVLDRAKGVVVMSIVKGGFIFSGRIGKGLVVAKRRRGWSAPSALGMGGAGWGLQIGGEITDFVLVLNTDAALDAFARGGSVTLGGNLSVAAGPIGRSAEGVFTLPPVAMFSYSRSRGVFAGASLEGSVIVERRSANTQFYGKSMTPSQLIFGDVPPPQSAESLYQQLK